MHAKTPPMHLSNGGRRWRWVGQGKGNTARERLVSFLSSKGVQYCTPYCAATKRLTVVESEWIGWTIRNSYSVVLDSTYAYQALLVSNNLAG